MQRPPHRWAIAAAWQALLLLGWQSVPASALHAGFRRVASREHPVESVISLLRTLISRAESERDTEQVTYMTFSSWCKNSMTTLETSITSLKDQIDSLESEVEAKEQEEKTLNSELEFLADELLRHDQAGQQALTERNAANELWKEEDSDLEETIDAIADAIVELTGAKEKVSGGSLLSQKQQALAKLLQLPYVLEQLNATGRQILAGAAHSGVAAPSPAPMLSAGDFEAHRSTYNFKSGNVIDLLKELKRKFEDDRLQATKEETNSDNAYQLAKVARDNAVAAAQSSQGTKSTRLGTVQGELGTARGSLAQAQTDLGTDTASLRDTKSTCSVKADEWNERSTLRKKEIESMEAAIKILSKVTGVRAEAPSNPALPTSESPLSEGATSFLQLTEDPKMKAVELLRQQAHATKSKELARFAQQVESHLTGPFDQVNNMIQKMIFRLMAEQTDEDNHKNWCDLELQKTNTSAENKEDKLESLKVEISAANARTSSLMQEIGSATKMVSDIENYMAELTEIRNAGKAENKAAIKDAKDAQVALSEAMAVLEAFYRETGAVPAELLQRGVELPEAPSTWDSAYVGIADPLADQPDGQGIITLLKAVSASFAQMEADTEAQEAMDAKAYQEELHTSEVEKARRTEEAELKSQEKKRLAQKVHELEASQKHVDGQLDALKQYLKDLEPACLHGDSTYEDRKAARSAEVQALKQAQVILQGAFKGSGTSFLQPIRRV